MALERLNEKVTEFENERALRMQLSREHSSYKEQSAEEKNHLVLRVSTLDTEIANLKLSLQHQSEENKKLNKEITILKEKSALLKEKSESIRVISGNIGEVSNVQQMELEIQYYQNEVDALQTQMIDLRSQMKEWQTIAENNDKQLKSLTETTQEYKVRAI